jgi:ABC-2 type transport system permease protein
MSIAGEGGPLVPGAEALRRPTTSWPATWVRPTLALAARGLLGIWRRPVLVATTLFVPCIVVVSFSGMFAKLTELPGFPTSSAPVWYVPLAIMESATLTGAGVAVTAARDIDSGFEWRLRASSVTALPLVASSVLIVSAGLVAPASLVLAIGTAMGVEPPGGAPAVALLLGVAIGTGTAVGLGGSALAFRLRAQQVDLLVQLLPISLLLLSDAIIPAELMHGWLRTVARVNPMSVALGTARTGFVGGLERTPVVLGCAAVIGAVAVTWLAAWWSIRLQVNG